TRTNHGHRLGDGFDLFDKRRWISDQIDLVQDHDRISTAFPNRHQIAFQSSRTELLIRAGHDEGGVDVGRNDLHCGIAVRGATLQNGAPIQHVLDDGSITVLADGYPIACRRASQGLAMKATRELAQRTRAAYQLVETMALGRNARRYEPRGVLEHFELC